jgi:hypothetical protein
LFYQYFRILLSDGVHERLTSELEPFVAGLLRALVGSLEDESRLVSILLVALSGNATDGIRLICEQFVILGLSQAPEDTIGRLFAVEGDTDVVKDVIASIQERKRLKRELELLVEELLRPLPDRFAKNVLVATILLVLVGMKERGGILFGILFIGGQYRLLGVSQAPEDAIARLFAVGDKNFVKEVIERFGAYSISENLMILQTQSEGEDSTLSSQTPTGGSANDALVDTNHNSVASLDSSDSVESSLLHGLQAPSVASTTQGSTFAPSVTSTAPTVPHQFVSSSNTSESHRRHSF